MNIGTRRIGAGLALLLLVGACSSDGNDDDSAKSPDAAGVAVDTGGDAPSADALAGATTPAAAAAAAATPANDSGADAAQPGAAAHGGAAAGAPPSPTTPGGFAHLPHGKGITDKEIELGIVYADTAAYNTAGQALGGTPGYSEVDDPKGIQNAVIEYFNANGGIAGRAIKPIWHEVLAQNAVTKEGRTRDAQAACATYTEDNEVFAIMGSGQWTEQNIIECAIKSDSPYIDGFTAATGTWASEEQANKFGRHYYTTSMFTTDRRERAVVQSLTNVRFFDKDAKVGLLIEGSSAFKQAADRTLKPALAAMGVEVAIEIEYPDIIESPWQNYVLQMQTAGVTHVYFGASTAESWPTLLFMRGAENQGYRPKYAISGLPVSWLETNAPVPQLENAVGFSWLPSRVEDEPPPASERDRICRQAVAAKKYPERAGLPFCDFFWFVKDTLERASELTSGGMQQAAERMGDGWMSTLTFGGKTRLGPGRHDGAYLGRDFRWNADAGKFDYAGGLYEVP